MLCRLVVVPVVAMLCVASSTLAAEPAVQVLVAYDSLHGNTEKMAQAVAEGARGVPGVEVVLRKVDQVTRQDLERARAIVLGAPTYYANIPGRMKVVLDDWAWKWQVDFTDKLGGAFSTGGGSAAGKEHVLVSLLLYMLNNRMVVAGPLYEDATGKDRWGEIGATAMTGPLDPGLSRQELDAARRLGQRLGRLAGQRSASACPQPR
jgi:NAD(P)H dehydrogenase (quinone)